MRQFAGCTVLVALFCAIGCKRSIEQTLPPAPARATRELKVMPYGIHEQTIQRDDGTLLRFTIFVPKTVSSKKPMPLVMALHFGGEVTPFYGRGMIDVLVGPALESLGAIVIAPDSIAGGWTNLENEAAVMQIMDSVIAAYNVDTSRTLLTGFSMGGRGTWYLAGRNQDRFAAAIPIAGSPTTDIDWNIPLYVIHSRDDQVVPLEPTQGYVDELKAKGSDVELVVIEGVSHHDTSRFARPLYDAIPWIRAAWKLPDDS